MSVPEQSQDWTITISPDGTVAPDNQYMQIGPLDSISFQNTTDFPVNITFSSYFDTIENLGPGLTSDPRGGTTELNTTLNFTIVDARDQEITWGPYAVE